MKLSYEFYPPKELDYQKVVNEFLLMEKYAPRFVSITYGAMGGSQEKSEGLIKAFKENTDVDIVAHLTLVGKSKEDIKKIIHEFNSLGVNKSCCLER
jgi:methylenetetrahydrofolate reductase (NADPH)